jgi:hypothetical protein
VGLSLPTIHANRVIAPGRSRGRERVRPAFRARSEEFFRDRGLLAALEVGKGLDSPDSVGIENEREAFPLDAIAADVPSRGSHCGEFYRSRTAFLCSMSRARIAASLALAGLLFAFAARGEKIRNHFDSDAPMREPGFFDLVVWGAPGEAEWRVLADFNPPSAPNKLLQTLETRPSGSIAVALRRTYTFENGTLSVGLRKGSGLGGVVLRANGGKDFLLLWIDVGSGDARLWSYRGGKGTELDHGKAELSQEWGTLSITESGSSIVARWNDKPLVKGSDPHPTAGRVGLATMGPGAVSFDEFDFEAAPAASR